MNIISDAGEAMTPARKAAEKSTKKSSPKKSSATKSSATKAPPTKSSKGPASSKADRAKAAAKSEGALHKAGLIDRDTMSDDDRKKLSKLKPEEVKALVAAKKKMGYTGKLNGPGADFF